MAAAKCKKKNFQRESAEHLKGTRPHSRELRVEGGRHERQTDPQPTFLNHLINHGNRKTTFRISRQQTGHARGCLRRTGESERQYLRAHDLGYGGSFRGAHGRESALAIFEERGVLVVASKVLLIENSNKPGALAKIAMRLAKAKINIEYAYLASSPGAKSGLLVLRAHDTKRALKVLSKN